MGDFGRRWTANHSDMDSDYRRELATNGVSGLHQEARGRDGGSGWAPSASTGRLSQGSSKNNVRADDPDSIIGGSTVNLERSHSSSAREEERRKVLEIEGTINNRSGSVGVIGRSGGGISRSTSRASRTAHVTNAGPRGYKGPIPRHLSAGAELDRDSQYSGHSSSQTAPVMVSGPSKLNRFDQHRVGVGRVRRSTSNANAAAVGGVRREIIQRKTKLPGGSLTSSVNSSESEQGSHAGAQSAVSRTTLASNRSVYLHAAAVADIPSTDRIAPRPPRALSAESRDNLAAGNGALSAQTANNPNPQQQSAGGPPSTNSNLKNSKKLSRSISLLAPWKPKPVQERFEIHYDNGNMYANPATRVTVDSSGPTGTSAGSSKPPRPPTAPPPPPTTGPPPVRRQVVNVSTPEKKFASSSDLHFRGASDSDNGNTTPAVILAERRAKAMEEKAKKASKVSRSVSMPKDTRIAGWFKKRKQRSGNMAA